MKRLSKKEKILACVDDEIFLLMKRVQLKFDMKWNEARDSTNEAIAQLCCKCWIEKKMYGLEKDY